MGASTVLVTGASGQVGREVAERCAARPQHTVVALDHATLDCGDRDAVLVIPADIVEAVAEEALKNYEYEEWAEGEVRKGRSLKGLFPVQGDQAKADYEAWKKANPKK